MKESIETLGVDLGGTNIRVARISAEGKILDRIIEHVPHGRDAQLEIIFNTVKKMKTKMSQAIGLGFPGRVRISDGTALTAGYLELKDVPLRKLLEEQLNLPAIVDTDANMALLAEYHFGAGKGYQNIIMLTIGTGIGGAIFSEGSLFYGGGNAGQLGHVTVDMNGKICKCGRRGCVETFSSGTALRGLIEAANYSEKVLVEDLFMLEKNGDIKAKEILSQWVLPLKMAIDSIIATMSPELVLLGGGLGESACRALELLTVGGSDWFKCDLKAGILKDDAGVIGAGMRAM